MIAPLAIVPAPRAALRMPTPTVPSGGVQRHEHEQDVGRSDDHHPRGQQADDQSGVAVCGDHAQAGKDARVVVPRAARRSRCRARSWRGRSPNVASAPSSMAAAATANTAAGDATVRIAAAAAVPAGGRRLRPRRPRRSRGELLGRTRQGGQDRVLDRPGDHERVADAAAQPITTGGGAPTSIATAVALMAAACSR